MTNKERAIALTKVIVGDDAEAIKLIEDAFNDVERNTLLKAARVLTLEPTLESARERLMSAYNESKGEKT